MAHRIAIKPDVERLRALLAGGAGQENSAALLDALEQGRIVRLEVSLSERSCCLVFQPAAPLPDGREQQLEAALAQALGPDLAARVRVLAPQAAGAARPKGVRQLIEAVQDPAEAERVRQEALAEEEARRQELLAAVQTAGESGGAGGKAASLAPGQWQTLIGRNVPEANRRLCDVQEEEARIAVEGEVVAAELRVLKSGRRLLTFDVTDFTDSISAKLFIDKEEPEWVGRIMPGAWIRVRGPVQFDKFANELTLTVEDLMLGAKPVRMDDAEEKRVELHLHTKMSAMDSCCDVGKAIERAARWGHGAVAITDHGVVQAFPAAYDAGKKHGIKVIFGTEAYLVDGGAPIVTRPDDRALDDCEIICLDLETTGLSPEHDEIIEIGAVKWRNGEIVSEFGAFAKPTKPIPEKIQELTGITPDMVQDAPPEAEVLQRFWDWVSAPAHGVLAQGGPGPILLAHNAGFDMGFIRIHSERLLGRAVREPVIDTLWMARALLPRLKSHNLATVTSELKIKLENHHRALSDAKTAAYVYGALLRLSREGNRGICTLNALNSLSGQIAPEQLRPTHVTVLVRTQEGLRNLYRLVSSAHLQYFYRVPRIPRALLQQHRAGLLLGTGCDGGEIFQAVLRGEEPDAIREKLRFYDFIEIMPVANHRYLVDNGTLPGEEELREINRRLCAFGQELGIPVVATGDVHFLDPQDEVYRQILKHGQGYHDEHPGPMYFRTTQEMLDEFSYLGFELAHEVVVRNTRAIADQVENVQPVPDGLFAPVLEGAEDEIRRMSNERARELYGDPLPALVEKRLNRELDAIIGNGYAVVYLTAHKLVKKSLDDGYLVGSRGSVGSSLVATMTRITEVNPLPPHYRCPQCKYSEFITDGSVGSGFDLPDKTCPRCGDGVKLHKDGHDIPFETFMGFEGDKVPDIDLNFSGEYQGHVHKYTEELFGSEQVFRAGTIATVAERTAFGYVRAYMDENGRPTPRRAEMNRLALGITGVKRTTGQHPGGLMVVPKGHEMIEFSPVQYPADDKTAGTRTTHFDYHSIEGRLLKLDILGHDDPTVLRMLQDITGIDVRRIPFDDPATQSLFTSLNALNLKPDQIGGTEVGTLGVPEFGTSFVRRMLVETQPQTFSDLIRISGLSHGTDVWTNNAQELIRNKVATLSEVIPCRDDIMVYLMYRGLKPKTAFKIMEKVRKGKGLSPEDEEEMRAHEVPEWYIDSCKKIKYMFPKAHAAAYVMMGFRIAWFKVHQPLAFYATYFTVRADEFDADLVAGGLPAIRRQMEELEKKGNAATAKEKSALTILEVAREMIARGFVFHRVDLEKSHAVNFLIEGNGLRPPFKSLQGLGENAAKALVAARQESPFSSIEDLRVRARLSKPVIELLQSHGALKGLPESNQLALF